MKPPSSKAAVKSKIGGPIILRPKSEPSVPKKRVRLPEIDLGLTVDLTFHFSAKHPPREGDISIKGSRNFVDLPAKDHLKAFEHKVKECSKLCDFSSPERDAKAKITKKELLKHLRDGYSLPNVVQALTKSALENFYSMILTNICRRLPVISVQGPLDARDSVIDDSWPHLSLVYSLITASFASSHVQNCITPKLLYVIVGNCMSLDDNERRTVRDVLSSIYTRFISLRLKIRYYTGEYMSQGLCSAELLEFFVVCIKGFNTPLKEDHMKFFRVSVLPLHSHSKLCLFADELNTCIAKLAEKQSQVLIETLHYMSKHWPCCDCRKQVVYVREIVFLFAKFTKEIKADHVKFAFKVIKNALNASVDVCNEALGALTEESMIEPLILHAGIAFPIIWETLCETVKLHWSDGIRANAYVVLQALQEVDPNVYRKMNDSRTHAEKESKLSVWDRILTLAKERDASLSLVR